MIEVVCLCPVFGRPRTTEMSAWMFLQQEYKDKAILFILDDGDTFAEEYDDFNIVLKRHSSRFPSLPAKYNYMIKKAKEWFKPNIFMVWENDDWYFPWHIRSYISAFHKSNADFVHPKYVYMADKKSISISPTKSIRFHGALAFSSRIAKDNLYPPYHSKGFDILLLERLNSLYKRKYPTVKGNLYSYCWYIDNPEFPQGSGWVGKNVDETTWYAMLGKKQKSKNNKFSPQLFDEYVKVINMLLPESIDLEHNSWNIDNLKKNLNTSELFTKRTIWDITINKPPNIPNAPSSSAPRPFIPPVPPPALSQPITPTVPSSSAPQPLIPDGPPVSAPRVLNVSSPKTRNSNTSSSTSQPAKKPIPPTTQVPPGVHYPKPVMRSLEDKLNEKFPWLD